MALTLTPQLSSVTKSVHFHYNHPLKVSKPRKCVSRTIPKSQQNENSESSSGLGFGSSKTTNERGNSGEKKKAKKRVIRRAPVEKAEVSGILSEEDKAKIDESRKNESAFLLTWFGLGGLILLQGIALAASGFLPDKWDKFLVKYLYPSFTPTVGLFLAGTVAYGVIKYLQNEDMKSEK